jgi:hypothetical protein
VIRHPVWTSLSHVDYQRAIAWSSALGLELGETVGMLAAAGLAAIEGGPRAVHSTVEKGVDDANAAGLGSAEGREVGEAVGCLTVSGLGALEGPRRRERPAEDILAASEPFMRMCGSCDAGLPMNCSCPPGDPRPIVSRLAAEVERLRANQPTETAGDAE